MLFNLLHKMHFMKTFIAETGRSLGDRFREHLRHVERNDNGCIETSRSTLSSP